MTLNKLPGLYYDEETEYELSGNGAKIPVIIGPTGTSTGQHPQDGTSYLKYQTYEDACKVVTQGGIGTHPETNPLLAFLKDFFEEAKPKTSEDLGVPYVYVIDLGTGTSKTAWTTALATAKTLTEATVEIYVAADNIEDYTLLSFLAGAMESIRAETHDLNLRCAYATKTDATDAQLIALTSGTGAVNDSRLFIFEPLLFGKACARFCCTPYYVEPGFLQYRSVKPDVFLQRTKTQELALQNAGVIFSHDEKVDTDIYTRINLSTSSSFALASRPADALGHSRFNADNLLRQIFKAVYPQIKDNEAASNIVKRQTKVDAIVDAEVEAERIIRYNSDTMEGTKLTLVESEHDPYDMELVGQIQPVNCTVAINIKAYIKNPIVKTIAPDT